MIKLRDYQEDLYNDIHQAWSSGSTNVMAVSSTGSGKTVLMSKIVANNTTGYTMVIAHRAELVNQISTTLALAGVRNQIIASKNTIKDTVNSHVRKAGRSFYDPNSRVIVASIDTLLKRSDMQHIFNNVSLWLIDEAHHVLAENKWGTGATLFPKARGLGVTATPIRADGKGLGRHADGVMDVIVKGPPMRELINRGFLTDYKIYCPPNDLNLAMVKISKATGDYNHADVDKAVKQSHIMGDIVDHYQRIAPGKQAIVFCTSVAVAEDVALKFKQAGVDSACIHGGTEDHLRTKQLLDFENRKIQVLTNVDLFGEGFDVPAIEVVIMARPTESYALYSQMFGRALRPLEGKSHAIIIDHVGNVVKHGLPDVEREWTLDRRDKRGSSKSTKDAIPLTTCTNCLAPYERIYKICPHCGHTSTPTGRGGPKEVDGDLTELDPQILAVMRGEIKRIDEESQKVIDRMKYAGAPITVAMATGRKHWERQQEQTVLRDKMAQWAGKYRTMGESDDVIMRRFYFKFGIDMGTAQTLNAKDASELRERIENE